jgi:hypothetical protein
MADDIPDVDEMMFNEHIDALSRKQQKIQGSSSTKALPFRPSGGLLQPVVLTRPDVLSIRNQRAGSISSNFTFLGDVLNRHEATIQKRWQDKKPRQRLEILRKAWGTDITSSHRPDIEAFYQDNKWHRENKARAREAYLLPYINEEDLVKPRNLLWFLSSRGKHHPSCFSATDKQAMHQRVVLESVNDPGDLPNHVMMFVGREEPSCYGEVLSVKEHAHAAEWLKNGQGSSVSHGLLILEAQDRIMSFLVSCIRLILHNVQDRLQGPMQMAPTLSEQTGTGFTSLATVAACAPYLPPAELDLDRMVSLLTARAYQSAFHLWVLREDPGYYRDYTMELNEHRKEMIKSNSPLPADSLRPGSLKREIPYWSMVLHSILYPDHMQYEMYSELLRQACRLRQILKKFADEIRPECLLPESCMHAVLKLRYYLREFFKATKEFKLPFAGSPLWRNYFDRKIIDSEHHVEAFVLKDTARLTTVQMRLGSLLSLFSSFKDDSWANSEPKETPILGMKSIGISKLMDALQHLVETEAEAKAMLTPYIASSIGNLATLSECMHRLEAYQPWASTFDAMMTDERAASLRKDHAEWVEDLDDQVGIAFDHCCMDLEFGCLGAPTRGRFSYPIEKTRNEANVEVLRKAELDLDVFWSLVDKQLDDQLGKLKLSALYRFLQQPYELQRTPPWTNSATSKVSPGISVSQPSIRELDLKRQLLTERTVSDETPLPQTNGKTKTRRQANLAEFDGDNQQAEYAGVQIQEPENINVIDHEPKFVLNARAMKVFKTIFFTPGIDATPGEIAWSDFLFAMKALGFVPQAMGGSEWHFHPTNVDVKHGIVFHSPHPDRKMSYLVARRHGRALRRAYGWEEHMFTQA